MNLHGRRATVMGLGRHGGGVAAARFLAAAGAQVTVTDLAPTDDLRESVAALADSSIARYRLGEHAEDDFRTAELVVVNPAVRSDNRLVALARAAGAAITSEIELFLERCPAPVIGVTGSNGKSTTAAMIAAIFTASGRPTWLGGNIGHSLLEDLPRIQSGDAVVLELSSFQLHWLGANVRWPAIAVVTNFAPNHLDWHENVADYRRAKQRLLLQQRPEDIAVCDFNDGSLTGWRSLVRGRHVAPLSLNDVPPLQLVGEHNRRCAALAGATTIAAGVERAAVRRGLSEFQPLPHRLNFIAEVAGRRFYNDSKATTPEAAIAALSAMTTPTWILLGGSDKGLDWKAIATAVGQRARGAATFGAVADKLDKALSIHAPRLLKYRSETLAAALDWCWQSSSSGDAILLSPGGASLDQYRDYAERGRTFVELVAILAK